ncbi:MAG: 30S ribosome-binding factor RbfA [candidate division Zixibacteria bacterium]|nr:30S ribosome-binding factor RbfA [candidate division Zixibacteria bacterium]
MRQFKRSDRLRSQILRDVQVMLEHECTARLQGMVTFTDVEISADLKYATIFYSVLGDDEAKQRASAYLTRIRKRVQSELGALLRLKKTPEIRFEFDPSIERGMRIEQILNELSRKDEHNDENK